MRAPNRKLSVGKSVTDETTVKRALERFRAALREKDLRYSKVRESIARAALAFDSHFDINDLVEELRRRKVKDAHMATVYRTLPLLIETGLIQATLLSSPERHFYEPAFERPHHDHLICINCGKVVEFEFEAFEVLQRDLAERYGFELTNHYHELLGRCPECRKASAKDAPRSRAST